MQWGAVLKKFYNLIGLSKTTEGLTTPEEKAKIIREQRQIRQQLRRFDMEAEVMGRQFILDRRRQVKRDD